eukprot:1046824-Amphidinium_carterae.1
MLPLRGGSMTPCLHVSLCVFFCAAKTACTDSVKAEERYILIWLGHAHNTALGLFCPSVIPSFVTACLVVCCRCTCTDIYIPIPDYVYHPEMYAFANEVQWQKHN